MSNKILLTALCVLVGLAAGAQTKDFTFRRKIDAVDSAQWTIVRLPADIYGNLNAGFTDLRILRIAGTDTTEVPYLFRINEPTQVEESVALSPVNESKKGRTQYITFQIPKDFSVNVLALKFEESNFDGSVKLEGSNDQREWFEIGKPQRIISIENAQVSFTSSTLRFPSQIYRFLRIRIEADKVLSLNSATVVNRLTKTGKLSSLKPQWSEEKDKKTKQSRLTIAIDHYRPVVKLRVFADETLDFYRPFRLERLADSVKSPKGTEYYYEAVTQGILTSLDSNVFEFPYVMAKKLRLVIDNADNAHLKVKDLSLGSPQPELVARLDKGDNYLYYGMKNALAPSYDIIHFEDKIPAIKHALNSGPEERLVAPETTVSPLIQNKIWLWVLMGVIIAVLGYFTVRMMKGK